MLAGPSAIMFGTAAILEIGFEILAFSRKLKTKFQRNINQPSAMYTMVCPQNQTCSVIAYQFKLNLKKKYILLQLSMKSN